MSNLAQCGRCGNLTPAASGCIEPGDGSHVRLCGDCRNSFTAWLNTPDGGRLDLAAINTIARLTPAGALGLLGGPEKYGTAAVASAAEAAHQFVATYPPPAVAEGAR